MFLNLTEHKLRPIYTKTSRATYLAFLRHQLHISNKINKLYRPIKYLYYITRLFSDPS